MPAVKVLKDKCIACGLCTGVASAVFVMGDDGLAENALGEEVPEDLLDSAKEAKDACPVQAIVIE